MPSPQRRPCSAETNLVAAARGFSHGVAVEIFHVFKADGLVAGWQDEFQLVADGELVFHRHLGETAGIIELEDLTDKPLRAAVGRVLQIVLIGLVRMALVKPFRVAAVGEVIQLPVQRRIEGAAGDSVIDGTPVKLRCARHIIIGLGAAFDLE